MMRTRRQAALVIAAGAVDCALTLSRQNARAATDAIGGLREDFAALEGQSGGRLGVAVLHTGLGGFVGHRADERFPMCSTFKLLAAAAVLKRVDEGKEKLDRRVKFAASDIVVYSPVTKERAGGEGMSLAELCAAAMTVSDNTAGNLILASLGGPQALNDYVRSLGDTVTRLDRIEPDLNEALPDDPRDTTTPAAMLKNIQALVVGRALSESSKEQLISWLVGNKTGDTRLRAHLPAGWRVGDKTGSGEHGTTNDVGVAWPPQSAPVLIAVYLTGTMANGEARNRTISAVGSAIADRLTERK
jgi:beta-lactamase class A